MKILEITFTSVFNWKVHAVTQSYFNNCEKTKLWRDAKFAKAICGRFGGKRDPGETLSSKS